MRLFKRKLTLREIHQLYLLLKPCLPETEQVYLLDEVEEILRNSKKGILLRSLKIIYGKNLDKKNTVELLVLFVNGLKNTNFFEYVNFVKGINGKT